MKYWISLPCVLSSCCVLNCFDAYAEPCTQEDAAKIEAAYTAELQSKCAGLGPKCSYKPAIDAKYRRKREAWVACEEDLVKP